MPERKKERVTTKRMPVKGWITLKSATDTPTTFVTRVEGDGDTLVKLTSGPAQDASMDGLEDDDTEDDSSDSEPEDPDIDGPEAVDEDEESGQEEGEKDAVEDTEEIQEKLADDGEESDDSSATFSANAVTKQAAEMAQELGAVAAEAVFDVLHGGNKLSMRIGGMNVTMMRGSKLFSTIQYPELATWIYTRELFTLEKRSGEKMTFKTRQAKKICTLMEAHIQQIAGAKGKLRQQRDADEIAKAKDGHLVGKFEAVLNSTIRAEQTMDSEVVGRLQKGEIVYVIENAVLPDGKIRLRLDKGWVSWRNDLGKRMLGVPQPDSARASKKQSSRRVPSSPRSALPAESLQALQDGLKAAGVDAPIQEIYTVTQTHYKKWPSGPFEISVGSAGITLMEKGKPFASYQYMAIRHWSHRKRHFSFEIREKSTPTGEPSKHTVMTTEGEGEKIAKAMGENSLAIKAEMIRKKVDFDVDEVPDGIWVVCAACTMRMAADRTSATVGVCETGQVVEVIDALKNEQGQWRVKIGRLWEDESFAAQIGSLQVSGEKYASSLSELQEQGGPWTSLCTSSGSQLLKRLCDTNTLGQAAIDAPVVAHNLPPAEDPQQTVRSNGGAAEAAQSDLLLSSAVSADAEAEDSRRAEQQRLQSELDGLRRELQAHQARQQVETGAVEELQRTKEQWKHEQSQRREYQRKLDAQATRVRALEGVSELHDTTQAQLTQLQREAHSRQHMARRRTSELQAAQSEAERLQRQLDALAAREEMAHAAKGRHKVSSDDQRYQDTLKKLRAETRLRREHEQNAAEAVAEAAQLRSECSSLAQEKAALGEQAGKRAELMLKAHRAELSEQQQAFELQRIKHFQHPRQQGTDLLVTRLEQAKAAQHKARDASRRAHEHMQQRADAESGARAVKMGSDTDDDSGAELSVTHQRIAELETLLRSARMQLHEERASANGKVQAADARLRQYREELLAREGRQERSEASLGNLQAQLADAQFKASRAADLAQKAETSKQLALEEARRHEQNHESLLSEIEKMRERALQENFKFNEQQHTHEEQLQQELSECRAELSRQHAAMIERVEASQKMFASHTEDSERQWNAQLSRAGTRIDQLESELSVAQGACEAAARDRAEEAAQTQSRVEALESVHLETEEELRVAQEQLVRLELELEDERAQRASLAKHTSALARESAQSRQDLDALREARDELMQMHEGLRISSADQASAHGAK